MKINGRLIGKNYPPYIIAEMSNNHLRDLDKAKKILETAAQCGVDAVKIQTYTPDSLTIDCNKPDFIIQDPLWRGKNYYQLYKEISMPLEWTEKLFTFAKQLGITIFSSPFDESAIDLLSALDAPAYKIASFEANDWPLIRKAANTGKPLIISTGISTYTDLTELLTEFNDCKERIALLHCLSSYPADCSMMNLNTISRLQQFGVEVGISDHSLPALASIAAVALGATIIEKHFTLSRADGGPDAAFSLEPEELKELVDSAHQTWKALGDSTVLDNSNRVGKQHARSIYAIKDINSGELLTEENIRVIRPGFGLAPKYLKQILGSKTNQPIERGTALDWSQFSSNTLSEHKK